MPRPIDKTLPRWRSNKYAHGYVKPGRGADPDAVMFFKTRSAVTDPVLRWDPSNKEVAVAQLDKWIEAGCPSHRSKREVTGATITRPTTLYGLVRAFRELRYPDIPASSITGLEYAIKHYAASDCPLEIDALIAHISNADRKIQAKNLLGDQTRKDYQSFMKRIFKFGVECRWLPSNPIEIKGLPRAKRRNENPHYTPEEMAKIIANRRQVVPHTAMFLEAIYLTGMRPGEALKLRLPDVDIAGDRLRITGKGSKTSNGPRIRNVPISVVPGLAELLRKLVATAKAAGSDRLFFHWTDLSSIGEQFTLAREAEQVPRYVTINGSTIKRTMYTIRSSAEWVMENVWGWDAQEIEDYTGHDHRVRQKHYRGTPEPHHLADRIRQKSRPVKPAKPVNGVKTVKSRAVKQAA